MSEAVTVTVTIPKEWARNLEVLIGDQYGPDDLPGVLAELADHAQQGVYRPGAWERRWLEQAFGYDWEDRTEPDPEAPMYVRPRQP